MGSFDALLALQELDTRRAQLDHRRAHLPEQIALNALEARLVADAKAIAPTHAERDRLAARQAELEHTIAEIDAKIEAASKQLYGGTVTSPRELQALEADIASLKKHRSEVEDVELEVLVACEPIDASLAAAAAAEGELDAQAAQLRVKIAEATVAIDAELAELDAARPSAVATVDASLLSRYEQIRKNNRGIGAARLEHGTCMSCRIKLSAVQLDRIKQLPPDTVTACEECSAILVP